MPDRDKFRALDKETLIDMLEDAAKNWLAHDGLWFQAVERAQDMKTAMQYDTEAWIDFTKIEARRIMKRHGLPADGGLEALAEALQFRLYAHINDQSMHWDEDGSLRFEMNDCRVQSARDRRGMAPFPCKSVGIAEYAYFAHTIDARIRTTVISCPPDPKNEAYYCAWHFVLEDEAIAGDEVVRENLIALAEITIKS